MPSIRLVAWKKKEQDVNYIIGYRNRESLKTYRVIQGVPYVRIHFLKCP
jgi:hypothetical protein